MWHPRSWSHLWLVSVSVSLKWVSPGLHTKEKQIYNKTLQKQMHVRPSTLSSALLSQCESKVPVSITFTSFYFIISTHTLCQICAFPCEIETQAHRPPSSWNLFRSDTLLHWLRQTLDELFDGVLIVFVGRFHQLWHKGVVNLNPRVLCHCTNTDRDWSGVETGRDITVQIHGTMNTRCPSSNPRWNIHAVCILTFLLVLDFCLLSDLCMWQYCVSILHLFK